MDWTQELIWNKAKIYATRAHSSNTDSTEFALNNAFVLELIGRSTLAFIHPALLADPTDGENIMYVFGLSSSKIPKSIPSKTVFERVRKAVEEFRESDYEFSLNFLTRRNQELHSGTAAFEDFPNSIWLSTFYRICKVLSEYQKRTLEDLFGVDPAAIAQEMIDDDYRKLEKQITELIRMHKDDFYRKNEEERNQLWEAAKLYDQYGMLNKRVKCPSCGGSGILTGQDYIAKDPYFREGNLYRDLSVVPTSFWCNACKLKLDRYKKLQVAGFGGYFSCTEECDPMEYYDFDPMEDYEEYMND